MSQDLTVIKNYRADTGGAVGPLGGHWTVLHFLIIFSYAVFRPMNLSVTCDNLRSCIRESMNCPPLSYWPANCTLAELRSGSLSLSPLSASKSESWKRKSADLCSPALAGKLKSRKQAER